MPLTRFEITSRVPYAEGRHFGTWGLRAGGRHGALRGRPDPPGERPDLRPEAGATQCGWDWSSSRPIYPSCCQWMPDRERPLHRRTAEPGPPPRRRHDELRATRCTRGAAGASGRWLHVLPGLHGSLHRLAMGRLPEPGAAVPRRTLGHGGGKPIHGETMVEIRPNERGTTRLLADRIHRPLPAAPGEQLDARLLVRDWEDGEDTLIPRSRWRFARETASGAVEPSAEHVWLEGGFEPGRIYQLVYKTDRAPVAGLGLLAARDVAAFLRTPSATNPSGNGFRALILYGISQTGRMQRHFLSLGLNRCEDGSRAYDGFHVHIAGARRGAFNHRFAQPSNQTTPLWGHVFPFADVVTSDPLTGRTGGLLERLATTGDLPKIISTDSAAEYWRGDAALAHIDTTGRHDLPEHPSTRRYSVRRRAAHAGVPRPVAHESRNGHDRPLSAQRARLLAAAPRSVDKSRSLDHRGHRSAAEPASPPLRCYGGRAEGGARHIRAPARLRRRRTRSACLSSGRWIWVATRRRASAVIRRRRARSIRLSSARWMPTATRRRASACRTSRCRSGRTPAGTHAIPLRDRPSRSFR